MNNNRIDLKQISFLFAFQITLLPSLMLSITALSFTLGIPITLFHLPLSLILTVGLSYIFSRDKKGLFFKTTALFLVMLLGFFIISTMIYDFSFDGQVYHQPAVILLTSGWNPFYYHFLGDQCIEFYQAAGNVAPLIEHFTKGSWILGSGIYALTGNLEGGKMFHLLFIVGAFMTTLYFLCNLSRIGTKTKLLIALLAALNPVCLYQVFSFYNDGLLSSMLTVLIMASAAFILKGERKALILTAAAIPILSNIKFTGIIYSGVVIGLVCVWLFFRNRNRLIKYMLTNGIILIVSGLFLGYQPYITNIIHNSNPFYPAIMFGKISNGAVETIEIGQAPKNFLNQNRFVKLGYSVLSKTTNQLRENPELKIPFSIYKREIAALGYTDSRYGGFGPLFGGTILLIMLYGVTACRWRRRVFVLFLTGIGFILFSILINPEAWWARLSPQLWLLPLLFITACFYTSNHKKINRYTAWVMIAILLVNCGVVFGSYLGYNLEMNGIYKKQLSRMGNVSKGMNIEYGVDPSAVSLSLEYRLKSYGVRFQFMKTHDIENTVPIKGTFGAVYWEEKQ